MKLSKFLKMHLYDAKTVRFVLVAFVVLTTALFIACPATSGGNGGGGPVPDAPTNIVAAAIPGGAAISLSAPQNTNSISHYNVYYSTTSGVGTNGTAFKAGAGTSFEVTGLTNDTTYYFVVTAANASGESPASAEISVTPVKSFLQAKKSDGSYVIPDEQITASSEWDGNSSGDHLAPRGRMGSGSIWASDGELEGAWWQVQFNKVETITSVVYKNRGSTGQFVETFYLQTSSDGSTFTTVQLNGSDHLFNTGMTSDDGSSITFELKKIG